MLKVTVLLQLFNKIKLRNGTKTYLEPKFFLFIVKFKKLGFSAPLTGNETFYVTWARKQNQRTS